MEILIVLLVGILAFGLPHAGSSKKRKFWDPWIENGLFPLVVGLGCSWFLYRSGIRSETHNFYDQMHAVLALALGAAGVLTGTQLRLAYLKRAGHTFLIRQTRRASLSALLISAVVAGLLQLGSYSLIDSILIALVLGALSLASSQRPVFSAFNYNISRRDIIQQHLAPCGWWNLLAMCLAAAACHYVVVDVKTDFFGLYLPVAAIAMGGILGYLAVDASDRSEAVLFFLAILGLTAGVSLIWNGSPLLSGIAVGAIFSNIALGRLAMIERLLEDLEQPLVIGVGFLSGFVITPEMPALYIMLILFASLVLRWLLRTFINPVSEHVSTRTERVFLTQGATGIIIIGCVAVHEELQYLVIPCTILMTVVMLLNELIEAKSNRHYGEYSELRSGSEREKRGLTRDHTVST